MQLHRIYGAVTAVIGVIHVVYNALWLRRVESPFPMPEWVVLFELAWALVSFDYLVRSRRSSRPVALALSYVFYTTFAVVYTFHLGSTHGTVTDAMVPLWWKVVALFTGAWFVAGGVALVRRRQAEYFRG